MVTTADHWGIIQFNFPLITSINLLMEHLFHWKPIIPPYHQIGTPLILAFRIPLHSGMEDMTRC